MNEKGMPMAWAERVKVKKRAKKEVSLVIDLEFDG